MAPARSSSSLPPIPPIFSARKASIIEALASPDYTDASPKGSVDIGIRELIYKINALEGLVTTSSCAGRISIFAEGHKGHYRTGNGHGEKDERANSGGKGGGRWLFVSHDPISLDEGASDQGKSTSYIAIFGLHRSKAPTTFIQSTSARCVRFQYEPLILHILCASLSHAQHVLSGAIASGFRESGVQSLKNLEDPYALPMVAVRSHGLALESMIGAIDESEGGEKPVSLVTEEYLAMLVNIANERFNACEERKQRFETALFGPQELSVRDWEDAGSRRRRKREEGLARQMQLAEQNVDRGGLADGNQMNEEDVYETYQMTTQIGNSDSIP